MNLSDLVESEGYRLVIDDNAADYPEALGTPQRDELCAQACKGRIIRMRSGLPEHAAFYAVSHEIAEDRNGFTGHHQAVWREQCAVLARWCKRLAANEVV